MKYVLTLLVIAIACSAPTSEKFSQQDRETINKIRMDYVKGWLANDKETVLNLFHEDATIVPSGLPPIQGMNEIEEYWFPNDSSVTTIHSYDITLNTMAGTDSMAYSLEKGVLNFTYEKGDFSMKKISISHATTVYKKQADGSWKIISRMWAQLQ